MTKAELRRAVLRRRDAVSGEEAQSYCRSIRERLFALAEFQRARCVLFFASFRSEVCTLPMIEAARRIGKRVALPIAVVSTGELDIREVCDLAEDVAPGVWGIPEPRAERCPVVPLSEIDLVVAPGVAFDETGGRLGHGGGFYDGFLRDYQRERPDGLVVALAFECQIVDEVPMKPKDVPIPLILTERRAIDSRARLAPG